METAREYFYGSLKPEDPYFGTWQNVRLLRMIAVLGAGGALAGFVIGLAIQSYFGAGPDLAYAAPWILGLSDWWEHGLVPVLWFASLLALCAAGVSSFFLSRKACPRCGKSQAFAVISPVLECSHCHLPKWAPDDPEKGQAND